MGKPAIGTIKKLIQSCSRPQHGKMGKSLNEVNRQISEDRIRIRQVGEAVLNGIRVSFHLYNNPEDVERIIESIRKIAG